MIASVCSSVEAQGLVPANKCVRRFGSASGSGILDCDPDGRRVCSLALLLPCGINFQCAADLIPGSSPERAGNQRAGRPCSTCAMPPVARQPLETGAVQSRARRNVPNPFRRFSGSVIRRLDCDRRDARNAQDRVEQRAILAAQPRHFRFEHPRVPRPCPSAHSLSNTCHCSLTSTCSASSAPSRSSLRSLRFCFWLCFFYLC